MYVNAGLLATLLAVVISRGGISRDGSAFAAPAAHPVAGAAGLYLTPGQVSLNTWGCYVMDAEKQVLITYEFNPGLKQLKLLAARDISNDRELKELNTVPPPDDIKRINQVGKSGVRGREPTPADRDRQIPSPPPESPSFGPTTRPELEFPGTPAIPKASDINGTKPDGTNP